MNLKDILNDLKPEDFVIRITPYHEDGTWDGDVQVSLVSSEENPLGEEDFAYLSHLHSYVTNRLNDEIPDVADEPNYTADGNVLTLTSKTRGNA